MKKFCFVFLLSVCFLFGQIAPFTVTASEGDNFMRIITEDTPFFINQTDENPSFYLPYTYYVKIISSNENFYHVEYQNVDGFVPKDFLFSDGLTVNAPFLSLKITTANTAVLYGDIGLSNQLQYLFENRSLNYYGQVKTDDGYLFYVAYNDKLGYVKDSDVLPFSIQNHPNPLTFLNTETPPIEEPQKEEKEDYIALKVVIFCLLFIAGIVALVFAVKGGKSKAVAISYLNEDDYE